MSFNAEETPEDFKLKVGRCLLCGTKRVAQAAAVSQGTECLSSIEPPETSSGKVIKRFEMSDIVTGSASGSENVKKRGNFDNLHSKTSQNPKEMDLTNRNLSYFHCNMAYEYLMAAKLSQCKFCTGNLYVTMNEFFLVYSFKYT